MLKYPHVSQQANINRQQAKMTFQFAKKTNPIKANFFKGQNELKIACRKIWPHPSQPSRNGCIFKINMLNYFCQLVKTLESILDNPK